MISKEKLMKNVKFVQTSFEIKITDNSSKGNI